MKRIVIYIVIILLILSSCAKKEQSIESNINYDTAPKNSVEEISIKDKNMPEKVIIESYMDIKTTKFRESSDFISKIIKKSGGYIESKNTNYNEYNNTNYINYKARIPKENTNSFREMISSNFGKYLNENYNITDVTSTYKDNEIRLKVLNTKLERLNNLLKKAEKVEDIITIETGINQTIMDIEIIKSNIKGLDKKIDYSTFNISLNEVTIHSPSDPGTFLEKIKSAFKSMIYRFIETIKLLIINIIYAIPYIIILLILVLLFKGKIKNIIYKLTKNKNDNDKEGKDV